MVSMMIKDYYDVFRKRSQSHGSKFKDLVRQDAILNFKRFLNSSPDAITVTINDSEIPITVATILEKETETKNKRFFLCKKEDNVKIGDFIYWDDTIWLTFMKTKDTIDAYDKFEALECKHKIKWVDNEGAFNEIPVFLIAQVDEKIKGNFRTWNNMITPQPNKYLEIITSRKNIKLGQKFILDNTAWFVVESDYLSVKNILYLSLTEDKIDRYCDDVENNLANFVDLDKFVIDIKDKKITLNKEQEYTIMKKIYLNGNLCENEKIKIDIIEGANLIEINDFPEKENKAIIIAKNYGKAVIRLSMEDNNKIYEDIIIEIKENAEESKHLIIDGDNTIKWGRTKIYSVKSVINGIEETIPATFELLDDNKIISNFESNQRSAILTANSNNQIGTVILRATTEDNKVIEKEIRIISLWM